jgi:hypothetical protein
VFTDIKKSPILLSIGGVGLIAIGVIALAYWQQQNGMPLSAAQSADANRFTPKAKDSWGRAIEFGWQAAVVTQTATTEADWQWVSELWTQAVDELEQIPGDSPQWVEAQAKLQEYKANLSYSQLARSQASVRELEMVSQLSATRLKPILEDGPMQVRFSTITVHGEPIAFGTASDGKTQVELIGSDEDLMQVNLVLPKSQNASLLTTTNVAYASHLLSATVPIQEPQQWLTNSFKQLEATPDQPIRQDFGAFQVKISQDSSGQGVLVAIAPLHSR